MIERLRALGGGWPWTLLKAAWYTLLIGAVALLWNANQGDFRYWGL